jgi:hypothetical protein
LNSRTEKATVPFPVPLAPEMITIHPVSLVAVHEHSLPVLTSTVCMLATPVSENEVGFTE